MHAKGKTRLSLRQKLLLLRLGTAFIAIVAALLIASILIVSAGANPLSAFYHMYLSLIHI